MSQGEIKAQMMSDFGDNDYEAYMNEGMTEGVNAISNAAPVMNGAIYNLSGQKVSENYKGIVIKEGKKLFVK
jgi:hypothetical protein